MLNFDVGQEILAGRKDLFDDLSRDAEDHMNQFQDVLCKFHSRSVGICGVPERLKGVVPQHFFCGRYGLPGRMPCLCPVGSL